MKHLKLFEELNKEEHPLGIEVERYTHDNDNNYGVIGGSTFYAPKGEGLSDYGDRKISAVICKTAKLFKYEDSREFAEDNNLMDIEYPLLKKRTGLSTLQQVDDAQHEREYPIGMSEEYRRNPNLFFWAFQEIAAIQLKKMGYDGVEWRCEDDMNWIQYQIWNRDIIIES
jgi:hypothetical protein